MKDLFEYLLEREDLDRDFRFGNAKGNSMFISYTGYQHMNLSEIVEVLIKEYKLSYDFDLGIEDFDKYCGRTFVHFKNVYNDKNN